MWPRVAEVMLGCWLALSPFIFSHPSDQAFLWANDFAVAAVLITISLVACWPAFEKVHYLNLVTAAYLSLVAYIAGGSTPIPPAYQNYQTVALLLLLLAVIPGRATIPPRSWQRFYEDLRERGELQDANGGEEGVDEVISRLSRKR